MYGSSFEVSLSFLGDCFLYFMLVLVYFLNILIMSLYVLYVCLIVDLF